MNVREAMVFAAGLGTRLGSLTDERPKALVEVGGLPLLERVARRLVEAGVERIVVNVHPFAERIRRFVRERGDFGVEVAISEEPDGPLETGGGLRRARARFRGDGPLLLHNVDVLTDLSLPLLCDAHEASGALATLAVMERETSRYLLFDERGLLGRIDRTREVEVRVREAEGEIRALAFSGIHVVQPELPGRVTEEGAVSILVPYLRLAAQGARILPFRMDGCRWLDVGKPASLAEATRLFP